jgi:UDP-N-acetylmuramyl pentapeptide phosphotransferase/UDP-N-acetylglucosamine-1-phosphate transferase
MQYLILPFGLSAIVSLLVILSARSHGHFSADGDFSGPQKFHVRAVPRVGGIGMFVALAGLAWYLRAESSEWSRLGLLLIGCGVPAFLFGLVEDLTKRVSPAVRLAAAAVSAALGFWLLDAKLAHTGIPGLDILLSTGVGAVLTTVFTVAGVTNAVNIIDGFNGLSSFCVSLVLLAYAYVAYQVGDAELVIWAVAGVGAALGFFVWNFPAGLIFMGDGGAYFMGFYAAELGLLLIDRHREVAPAFALAAFIYPVFEAVFSIYRRRVLRNVPSGQPDGIHLHSLVFRRVSRWAVTGAGSRALTRRNSMTAPYLWLLCLTALVPSVLFWRSQAWQWFTIAAFAVIYVSLYWRIVRFRTPRWLLSRRAKG